MFLDIDANIGSSSGGVGEAYPGSTGGEIFNYYGTDSYANTASGDYSTTIGYYNKNTSAQSFVSGYYNELSVTQAGSGHNMVAGQRHKIITDPNTNNYVTDSVVFGNSNEILLTNWGTGVTDLFLMGSHLKYQPNSYNSLRNCLGIGKYNSYSFQVTDPLFFIGNGASDASRTNALEVNASTTKLLTNLQLATDTTAVNAITPAKSSPASADDMTLVTKSYITSQSINYEPSSEVQLNAVTTYSLGTLIGDPNWSFPYSSGSITLVFSIDQIFHTVHIPIPSYLNTSIHPIIKAPLTDIHNYQITDPGDSGTLKGLLLFYNPSTKEISLENPECVNIDNIGDSISDAFNYGNIDIWFWGMTCYNHF